MGSADAVSVPLRQAGASEVSAHLRSAHRHVAGCAQAHAGSVGSYDDFIRDMLPRIKSDGYTAVQLMGVPEHPLYKSFGYQVSSYFAPSSRYGTPDGFCRLVDEAHHLGLSVILDITHAHACANTEQGIARYDTSSYFFDERSNQWGTPSFDFSKDMTRRFCCRTAVTGWKSFMWTDSGSTR